MRALETAGTIAATRGAKVSNVPHVAKLSITGVGMRSHAGVADRLFAPLMREGINIDLISTSEVRLNIVVAALGMNASQSIHMNDLPRR